MKKPIRKGDIVICVKSGSNLLYGKAYRAITEQQPVINGTTQCFARVEEPSIWCADAELYTHAVEPNEGGPNVPPVKP